MRILHSWIDPFLILLAVPTGLNLMPTADVLSPGQIRVDYESAGGGQLYVPSGEALAGVEGGSPLGLEAGVDQAGSPGLAYNAKWRFWSNGVIMPAIAIGIQGYQTGETAQAYLVATKPLLPTSLLSIAGVKADLRLSAGVMRHDSSTAIMYGASGSLGPFTLKADHINGSDSGKNGDAVGASWTFGKSITLGGTYYFYLTQPHVTTVTVSYLF